MPVKRQPPATPVVVFLLTGIPLKRLSPIDGMLFLCYNKIYLD